MRIVHMHGAPDEERIISTGILQNNKETYKSGVMVMATGVAVLLIVLVMFLIFFHKGTSSDGRAVYEIDQFGFFLIMLLVAAIMSTQILFGVSNMYAAKKLKKVDFSTGERRTLLVVKEKGFVEMYGEIEVRRVCPKCNTATGLSSNYCMKCGAELSEDESESCPDS